MEISKREFLHHISQYLKPGKLILTNRGKKEYVITIERYNKDVVTRDVTTGVPEKKSVPKISGVTTADSLAGMPREVFKPNYEGISTKYGCGCPKTDKLLCGKHVRS